MQNEISAIVPQTTTSLTRKVDVPAKQGVLVLTCEAGDSIKPGAQAPGSDH